MFIRVKRTPNSPRCSVQICENTRDAQGRVRQSIVRHVGIAQNDAHLEQLKQLALVLKEQIEEERKGPLLFPLGHASETETQKEPPADPVPEPCPEPALEEPTAPGLTNIPGLHEEQRLIEGFHDIFGKLFRELGLHTLLSKKQTEVLLDVVLARIARPASKRKTQFVLTADFGRTIALDRIYRMMDALTRKKELAQQRIFTATQQLCFGEAQLILFDVTTLYFESTEEDNLRAFGYSKDQKFHTVQVVLALATTSEGLPIGYHLFPGNTADTSTLVTSLEEWRKHLPIGNVVLVADRAMMTEKNLAALEAANIKYVVAAKLRKLPPETREKILAQSEDDIRLDSILENGRRLIVTYDSQRAKKDQGDRERIIQKIKKKIGNGKTLKRLVSNRGYQKFLKAEGEGTLAVDDEKIAQEACWDGLHGVITNMHTEKASALLSHYHRLWVIEESFRVQKHNLAIRPIYHFKSERIEGHILICYLAFALIRHLQMRLKLQQTTISIAEANDALWRTQASILYDDSTGKKLRVPSPLKGAACKIYQALGVTRVQKITEL
jgi:transposase